MPRSNHVIRWNQIQPKLLIEYCCVLWIFFLYIPLPPLIHFMCEITQFPTQYLADQYKIE